MNLNDLLKLLKELVEEFAPALAVALWNYEESKVDEAKNEALDAKVNLELEKNHESVDEKYKDCPDIAIVNDAIAAGGGGTGQSEPGGESSDEPAAAGTKLGSTKS